MRLVLSVAMYRYAVLLLLVLEAVQGNAQLADQYFEMMDSMQYATPHIDLCQKNGKEDLRFMSKAPEKYSDYKDVFAIEAANAFSFDSKSHFFCDITVEINCEGQAGNYSFAVEPRTFNMKDYEDFKQLISIVEKLRGRTFKPAYYLGENVNSKVKFRLAAYNGKAVVR
jgi:hypothetical protein